MVGYGVSRRDGAALAEGFEVGAAAQVLEVAVGDGEVGGEHGGSDFVAVGTVADEGVDEAGALGGLRGGKGAG